MEGHCDSFRFLLTWIDRAGKPEVIRPIRKRSQVGKKPIKFFRANASMQGSYTPESK